MLPGMQRVPNEYLLSWYISLIFFVHSSKHLYVSFKVHSMMVWLTRLIFYYTIQCRKNIILGTANKTAHKIKITHSLINLEITKMLT